MNDLQIRVIETRPAAVNFNHQEIDKFLDDVLEKYKGLQFTEETAGDCKKTIAELRKVQTSLDDFRKETKKNLTESVTAFENQCKQLYSKFDTVISPLTSQYEQFEIDRKEVKRKLIQAVVDKLVIEKGLDVKRAAQLIIPDDYLNKGKSMKAIKSDLSSVAASLKISQDKEAQDIELIKTKVELANAKYQLAIGLTDGTYISMLKYSPIDGILERINADAEELQKRERKVKEATQAAAPSSPVTPEAYVASPRSIDFGSGPDTSSVLLKPQSTAGKVNTEVLEVKGTDTQFDALEAFLNTNNYKWSYK